MKSEKQEIIDGLQAKKMETAQSGLRYFAITGAAAVVNASTNLYVAAKHYGYEPGWVKKFFLGDGTKGSFSKMAPWAKAALENPVWEISAIVGAGSALIGLLKFNRAQTLKDIQVALASSNKEDLAQNIANESIADNQWQTKITSEQNSERDISK
jgi:hypothetical protein